MDGSAVDAQAFFAEVVEPTVTEFLKAPHDKRRGCLSCLVLSSMVEHYFFATQVNADPTKLSEFRRSLCEANWAFRQVTDVANATKHVLRRKGRVGYRDVDVQEITVGNLRCDWPINGSQTMVEVEPGNVWLLSDLVQEALRMWKERLCLEFARQE